MNKPASKPDFMFYVGTLIGCIVGAMAGYLHAWTPLAGYAVYMVIMAGVEVYKRSKECV